MPAVAQTCHSHEHLQAMTIARRHRSTVSVPAPVLLRPISPAEGPIRATMKLYERGPPLSLAEWTGLAPIGEHPSRGFAIAQPTAPGRDVGRIWHIPRPVIYHAISCLEQAGLVAPRPRPAAGPAGHVRRHRRRAQGSCGLIGHPVQPVRYVRSHPLNRAGTDGGSPVVSVSSQAVRLQSVSPAGTASPAAWIG